MTQIFCVSSLGAMAKRRAEIEEEQELEEETLRTTRLSVSNEGEVVGKGSVETKDCADDVEMEEEAEGMRVKKDRKSSKNREHSAMENSPENGDVEQKRSGRDGRKADVVEDMEEEEGEIE